MLHGMRRWVIAAALAAGLVAVATGLAASSAKPGEKSLADFFGPRMARAEVILVVGNTVHDYRIDQGRVVSVRPGMVELLERDGSRQMVPVAPDARITINGAPAAAEQVQRGMFAITVRDGSAPAELVRAVGAGKGRPGR